MEYKYDIVKLVKQLCNDPIKLGNLIAKMALYLREQTNSTKLSFKSEIDNPFKQGETIVAEFNFKTK